MKTSILLALASLLFLTLLTACSNDNGTPTIEGIPQDVYDELLQEKNNLSLEILSLQDEIRTLQEKVDAQDDSTGTIVDNTQAAEEDDISEPPILESDPLPESWHGEWIVVETDLWAWFTEGDVFDIKEYDNAVLYTKVMATGPLSLNRWFFYDEANQILKIYRNPPPFENGEWEISFDIRRATESELLFTRERTVEELKLVRELP